jgi:hypothetical protein
VQPGIFPDRPGEPVGTPAGRAFPKKEVAINPINPRMGWEARFDPGRKSSISRSFLTRFRPRLAGSNAADVLQGLVFFSYLISNIFVAALFEWTNKIMLR